MLLLSLSQVSKFSQRFYGFYKAKHCEHIIRIIRAFVYWIADMRYSRLFIISFGSIFISFSFLNLSLRGTIRYYINRIVKDRKI